MPNKLNDKVENLIILNAFITFLSYLCLLLRFKDNDILKYLVNIYAKTYFCQLDYIYYETKFVPNFLMR